MPFDSYVFVLIFLPLLVLVWRTVAIINRAFLNYVLLGASLLFCLWASPAGLALLILLVPVNYGLGLALAAPGEREGAFRRRGLLVLALLVNFAPLVLLRYLPIVQDVVPALFEGVPLWQAMGESTPQGSFFVLETAHFAGLSFFSLVQCAWLVSVYRRHIEPEGLMRHGLFSLAFPYLLAGPVVRYEQMGRQFDALQAPALPMLTTGLGLFVAGLAKKILLANWLGSHADAVFAAAAAGDALSCIEAWLGTLAFSFQIYFDFSGYTDMALGIGLMLGLRLPENFASPYRACGFIDFWRRWHITLSTWLRDLVYQPLAGPWPSLPRAIFAVIASLAVCALWHGTALTLFVWAGLHGLFLALNGALRALRVPLLEGILAAAPVRVAGILLTFLLVTLLWVIFRADTPAHALAMYTALFTCSEVPAGSAVSFTGAVSLMPLVLAAVIVFALPTAHEVFLGRKDGERAWLSFTPSLVWAIVLAAAAFACLTVMDMTRPFIF